MSSISSLDIISVIVLPHPKTFLCITASALDAAAVNPNGINTLLANGVITFLLILILFLLMGQKVYQEILVVVSF